jgi:hypothetical protein
MMNSQGFSLQTWCFVGSARGTTIVFMDRDEPARWWWAKDVPVVAVLLASAKSMFRSQE